MPAITTMHPILEPNAFLASRAAQQFQSLIDLPHVAFTSQGRYAIAHALRLEKIGRGDKVILPSYHCTAMTAAIHSTGALPIFCPVDKDLSLRLDYLASIQRDDKIKAIIVPHYFAWKQPSSIFAWIHNETTWTTIEDCAHSFFSSSENAKIGTSGNYAIGSIAKFFPFQWGGILASTTKPLPLTLLNPPRLFDAKLLVNAIENSAAHRRLGFASIPLNAILSFLTSARKRTQAVSAKKHGTGTLSTNIDTEFNSRYEALSGGRLVKWATHNQALRMRMAERRFEIFNELKHSFANLRYATPFNDSHPPDFPPYVFPLLIKNTSQYQMLRKLGVPLHRWDNSEASTCENSETYSQSLIQFPCHPTISKVELSEIIKQTQSLFA